MYSQLLRAVRALALVAFTIALLQSATLAWSSSQVETVEDENPMYHGALPWELPDDAERMVVHSVTDGDTVRLTYPNNDWYYNTRIIGIQAPEMDGPWTEKECYGPEAKEFLKELLPVGTEIYAQKDISDEDPNGRRLRHLFVFEENTGNAYLISEILVLGGYAEARAYEPDDLYDDILDDAEEVAKQDHDGLWESCST